MGEEYEAKSLFVVFPDGYVHELPIESVTFEFPTPDVSETMRPCEFSGSIEATFDADPRVLGMLFGRWRIDRRELLMHHRRRSPHGWRYRSR